MEKIAGPIEGHGHSGVTDVKSYKLIHARITKAAERDVLEVGNEVSAYVNHGRWVVDCACNGAGLTAPEFGLACCFDCGRVYTKVVFPKDRKQIEGALLVREDKETRNWIPGESVASLRKEKAG
jgi:hypothetical protein|tara:strand:+ start:29083 stop:29454 length:372 start_codon:yes stop_codon:yes gene_type:complete